VITTPIPDGQRRASGGGDQVTAVPPFLPGYPGDHRPRHVVVILSGGLDSTTLAYWLASRGAALTLLTVDYGQRHRKEIRFARRTAVALQAAHHVADLSFISQLAGGR